MSIEKLNSGTSCSAIISDVADDDDNGNDDDNCDGGDVVKVVVKEPQAVVEERVVVKEAPRVSTQLLSPSSAYITNLINLI